MRPSGQGLHGLSCHAALSGSFARRRPHACGSGTRLGRHATMITSVCSKSEHPCSELRWSSRVLGTRPTGVRGTELMGPGDRNGELWSPRPLEGQLLAWFQPHTDAHKDPGSSPSARSVGPSTLLRGLPQTPLPHSRRQKSEGLCQGDLSWVLGKQTPPGSPGWPSAWDWATCLPCIGRSNWAWSYYLSGLGLGLGVPSPPRG